MTGIIRIVAPTFITFAILGAVWYFQLIPIGPLSADSSVHAAPDQQAAINYSIRERVVNLADGPAFRYLKVQVTLEFADPKYRAGELKGEALTKREEEFAQEIAAHRPAIEDFLITTLTRKTTAELLTSEGKEALRQQLLEGFRQRIPEPHLRAVYFTEFVIQ